MTRLVLVVASVGSFLAATASPRVDPAPPACLPDESRARLVARFDHVLDSLRAAHPNVPAMSVAVESPSRCVQWARAVGVRDLASKTPATAADAHRMASITKTYVAAAILRLAERGKLAVSDTITKHLSATSLATLRRGGYDPALITIAQLLTHTAGIYDYAMDRRFVGRVQQEPSHRWTRQEQLQFAVDSGTTYGMPGERFHYSDTHYILLGEIVERLTGLGLGPALRSLLHYDKLGLRSTWLESLEPAPRGVARLHQYFNGADTYDFDPSIDLYGGGGLAAPPSEIARFFLRLGTGKVFDRAETLDLMTKTIISPTQNAYRLGISVREVDGIVGYGHTGFWNSFAAYYPSQDVAIAGTFTSTQAQGLGQIVTRAVLAALRDSTDGVR